MRKKKRKKNNIIKILPYFKKYKLLYIICFLMMLLTDLGTIIYGGIIGEVTQSLISGKIKKALLLLLIYITIEIISNIINRIREYLSNKNQIIISRKIGFDTYDKAMKLPAYAYEKMSSGEVINRITNDTENIVGSIDQLMNIASYVISAAVLLIYIFLNSWILGIEIIIFLIVFSYIIKFFQSKLKIIKKDKKETIDKYTSVTNESIRGYREITVLGISNTLKKDVKSIISDLLSRSIAENKVQVTFTMISQLFRSLLEVGVFATCAILISQNKLTISFFIAMTYYIYQYTYILQAITDFAKKYQDLDVSLERINEILQNEKFEDVQYGNTELNDANGVIEFKDVEFAYPDEATILKDFNIKFEPNKKIAIVGSSGGGKTTLFNLITRLFEPIKGEITLDGVNIKNLTEDSLRNNISIIRQEPFIFNRTIYENFKILDPKVTKEQVKEYCKLTCIDGYIQSLPNGYDTLLGEGGVNLSGGQKQRLSIARTLLKKSKVILFDEATSALDNESQEIIKKTIDNLSKNHTVIIIAHRLSTIIDSDVIHVIKAGKVYATGVHRDLIKTCDYYRKLYTKEDQVIN